MSEIDSPLGRLKIAEQQSSRPRMLNVPDESGFQAQSVDNFVPVNPLHANRDSSVAFTEEEMEQVNRMRQEAKAASQRISSVARERIEILTGLNRIKQDVEVEGVLFSIRSLKSSEMRDITIIGAAAKTPSERYFTMRDAILTRALYAIDGQDIKVVLGSPNLELVAALLSSMEHSVVERIFEHYENMVRENNKKISSVPGKELGDDLKKS